MKHPTEKPKLNPLVLIRELIEKNKYKVKAHAIERQIQRSVSLRDTLFVLKHGIHEGGKDQFDVKRQSWRYAIRGKTPDNVDIRVVVAVENLVVIITVIKPGR